MPDFHFEKEILSRGYGAIAGLDEAGRGALFGPVVAASVMFPPSLIRGEKMTWLEEIDDSKRISPTKREMLARLILIHSNAVGIGMASSVEIDAKNIYWASFEAMKRAFMNMPKVPDFLLVDGFRLNDVNYPQMDLPKGDQKSISIAAASIIAKVTRDRMMTRLDRVFEGYGLSRNKGYGTKEHYNALQKLGPTAFHRRSYNLESKK
ncbi:MAG: ribonuclease HII [Candidatus Aminicenantes bacterium]